MFRPRIEVWVVEMATHQILQDKGKQVAGARERGFSVQIYIIQTVIDEA